VDSIFFIHNQCSTPSIYPTHRLSPSHSLSIHIFLSLLPPSLSLPPPLSLIPQVSSSRIFVSIPLPLPLCPSLPLCLLYFSPTSTNSFSLSLFLVSLSLFLSHPSLSLSPLGIPLPPYNTLKQSISTPLSLYLFHLTIALPLPVSHSLSPPHSPHLSLFSSI
jgi:hypothetical protein